MYETRHPLTLSILAFSPVLAMGCATLQSAPREPEKAEIRYVVPKVELAEGSKADLEKDGVRIVVAPQPFVTTKRMRTTYTQGETLFVINNQMNYDVRRTPYVRVEPKGIVFHVKVVNNLQHVLKMAGTVVSYTASGKQIPVPKANYEEFLNGIIRPAQEAEFTILGPTVAELPPTTNLSFALDDVCTATDAAGNVTKRTSYEWIYAIEKQDLTETLPVEIEQLKMTPVEAAEKQAEAERTGN